jgi:hypothetical protein
VVVGTFNGDLPPSKEALKRAAKNQTPIPQAPVHRRHGASAYLRPNINWDCAGITWVYIDSKGQAVNPKYIILQAGYTHDLARTRAIIHWDECESARVGRWNYLLAVYFARNRLLHWLQDHPRPEVAPVNPAIPIPREEQLGDIITIRTGSAMLALCVTAAKNIEAATKGRIGGVHSITKAL